MRGVRDAQRAGQDECVSHECGSTAVLIFRFVQANSVDLPQFGQARHSTLIA